MSRRVSTAVVGLGMFGALHAHVYAESPLAHLQAVVSRSPARAREIGERHGARWYTSCEDMLIHEPDVEAISIVTRDAEHKAPALACTRAGKAILLEKPMAANLSEADEIIAAVEAAHAPLMVNFTLHFNPAYVAAFERIQAGEIGDVVTISAHRDSVRGEGYPGQPIPYAQWTDMLISTAIHELEAMTWYAGSPVRQVFAQSSRVLGLNQVGDDVYMALLRFESGALGYLETNELLPLGVPSALPAGIQVIGTQGTIQINDVNSTLTVCTDRRCWHPDVSYWPVLRGRAVGDLRESITHFLTCLLTGEEPALGARQGRLALQLVEAIKASCRIGQSVSLA